MTDSEVSDTYDNYDMLLIMMILVLEQMKKNL